MTIQQAKCPPIATSYVPAARLRALYIIRHQTYLLSTSGPRPLIGVPSPSRMYDHCYRHITILYAI